MSTGYLWPILGDQQEVAFPFFPSRAHACVSKILKDFQGNLLSDGYGAYEKFTSMTQGVRLVQCWSHSRREFVKAESLEPSLSSSALEQIGELYKIEAEIKENKLHGVQKYLHRQQYSKPLANNFFQWLKSLRDKHTLLPSNSFTKALNYVIKREEALKVYLLNPDIPMDTNELEQKIRPGAIGRKNWLFAWTEVGAKYVGIIQSLISSCIMQDIDPYVYLVDVLQRVQIHPANQVYQLTPRNWKLLFANNPMLGPLDSMEHYTKSAEIITAAAVS